MHGYSWIKVHLRENRYFLSQSWLLRIWSLVNSLQYKKKSTVSSDFPGVKCTDEGYSYFLLLQIRYKTGSIYKYSGLHLNVPSDVQSLYFTKSSKPDSVANTKILSPSCSPPLSK